MARFANLCTPIFLKWGKWKKSDEEIDKYFDENSAPDIPIKHENADYNLGNDINIMYYSNDLKLSYQICAIKIPQYQEVLAVT